MFEKTTKFHIRNLLQKQFNGFPELGDEKLKINQIGVLNDCSESKKRVSLNRSTNERNNNMTRKTRSRQLRIHSAFQSGFCALCHIPYNSLEDHLQSKRHLKLIGDDGNFISIKTVDSLLALDGIDEIEVNDKGSLYSPCLPQRRRRRGRMPRTRTSSVMCDKVKDCPLSPRSESGHRLRSRKNINYMTPPLEEDSLSEKPEVVTEYRELRSSTRLLAKLTDRMVETDEVWNSGRPKRSCNRSRISADERLVVDNKSYYKVEVLPSKLRSGVTPFHNEIAKRPETPINEDDKGLIVKFRKLRNSELIRLNNEAENFLFPKKDETTTDDDDDDDEDDDSQSQNDTNSITSETELCKSVKIEDEESMHSTSSEGRSKKRRRTHAEAFIRDNQKYYKFETPGSRLRYQGSYLSPVPMKAKNNGDCAIKTELDDTNNDTKNVRINLNEYKFSFEHVPKKEAWYQTFHRRDMGEEKYAYLNDDNYWDPLILPYQLDYILPLDPNDCISQYNTIKKCLMEPLSASTSVTCSTPDPNASNSSVEPPFTHDEDSAISATEISSNSNMDEIKPVHVPRKRGRRPGPLVSAPSSGKNPRKSPRQHASTLAILSSLIHQRKRKTRRPDSNRLSAIAEEPKKVAVTKSPKKEKIDYFSIARRVEEEFASMSEDISFEIEDGKEELEEVQFKGSVGIEELISGYGQHREIENNSVKKVSSARPGRKPGKRKKNRTGWPLSRNRRARRDQVVKEEDDSTVDSLSINADSEENDPCEDNLTDSIKMKGLSVTKTNSENNNKNDQSSLVGDVTIDEGNTNCDLNTADRVGRNDCTDDLSADKVLTNKVNNSDSLEYQPYVRVQKLEKNRIDSKSEPAKRSSSPKRTNRGQRRMPASPKSPRMLRRPRGRWYRER